MHLSSDAVSDEFPDYGEASGSNVVLNGSRYLEEMVAASGELDAFEEALSCDSDELFGLSAYLTARNCPCCIRLVALVDDTGIQTYDIAFLEDPLLGRDPVDDNIIDRDADRCGVAVVAEEGCLTSEASDDLGRLAVDLPG